MQFVTVSFAEHRKGGRPVILQLILSNCCTGNVLRTRVVIPTDKFLPDPRQPRTATIPYSIYDDLLRPVKRGAVCPTAMALISLQCEGCVGVSMALGSCRVSFILPVYVFSLSTGKCSPKLVNMKNLLTTERLKLVK